MQLSRLCSPDRLNGTQQAASDTRPGKVAQAKASFADDSYPSPRVIDRVARVLAQKFAVVH
ncbi:MAG: hypothetical protein C5B50_17150 [Verrucomicrobia bacterium]|nr:MAG: hypothetical protein C5B50_17150 [Verrucomicrobiota bacterium]